MDPPKHCDQEEGAEREMASALPLTHEHVRMMKPWLQLTTVACSRPKARARGDHHGGLRVQPTLPRHGHSMLRKMIIFDNSVGIASAPR